MLGRICLIGETQVGKTSLVQSFTEGKLSGNHGQTVGAVFQSTETTIDGRQVALQIWDTAGQERYRSLGPIYYRESQAAIAVFDLTRPETLIALDGWIKTFRENAASGFVVVVGNKEDLTADIKLEREATNEWAAKRYAECIWASAKTGVGVPEVFHAVCKYFISGGMTSTPRPGAPAEATSACC
jgi:small GTP-binding protein